METSTCTCTYTENAFWMILCPPQDPAFESWAQVLRKAEAVMKRSSVCCHCCWCKICFHERAAVRITRVSKCNHNSFSRYIFFQLKTDCTKLKQWKLPPSSLKAFYFSRAEMKPLREMVFYWITVNSLQILLIQDEVWNILWHQNNLKELLQFIGFPINEVICTFTYYFFSVWLPASKKKYFHSLYSSSVAVEAKTSLMIQFPLLIIWENRQLCNGVLLSSVKDAFEKRTPSECFKDFKKSFEIWNANISGKIFVIRTSVPFIHQTFHFFTQEMTK